MPRQAAEKRAEPGGMYRVRRVQLLALRPAQSPFLRSPPEIFLVLVLGLLSLANDDGQSTRLVPPFQSHRKPAVIAALAKPGFLCGYNH